MKFSFALSSLLVGSALGSSNAELNHQHRRSFTTGVTSAEQEEDITPSVYDATIPDIPRALKKKAKGTGAKEPKAPKSTKKPKVPKGAAAPGKEPKSAKGSGAAVTASPSAQTTSQTTSLPTDELTSYALLTLKAGFTNGNDILSDWDSTTEPCSGDDSNWTHITCSAGKVTNIILGK